MNNLSFHITDIVANSIRANASEVTIIIRLDNNNVITLSIADNGCGMDEETVRRVTNPFYTTRTTRKVGMGLPFLIQNAEQTGGNVTIESVPGKGTTVTARFVAGHIDCPPWGDLPGTLAMTITGNPEVNIHLRYETDQSTFTINTEEIKEALGDIPLSLPKVTVWLQDMIRDAISSYKFDL